MPAPNDLNDRIAKAKGWTYHEWYEEAGLPETRSEIPLHTHWRNPSYQIAPRPDFTGALRGVAGMLRELNEHEHKDRITSYSLYWSLPEHKWFVMEKAHLTDVTYNIWWSPKDRPGDCVGEAWMSVFGKEPADAGEA